MDIEWHKHQVRRFYDEIWNTGNLVILRDVLHEDFGFRGSLGQAKRGHAEFSEYVKMVTGALAKYRCDIIEMVAENDHVFARMKFSGIHKGSFMGFEPTGRPVSWAGAALFTFESGKVSDLWVLGDLFGLVEVLHENQKAAGN